MKWQKYEYLAVTFTQFIRIFYFKIAKLANPGLGENLNLGTLKWKPGVLTTKPCRVHWGKISLKCYPIKGDPRDEVKTRL